MGGRKYEEERNCPKCGAGAPYRVGYNERTLAILIENGKFKKVQVKVRRFRCKECGNHYYAANAPFYPRCNYGKIIVDLCLYLLSKQNPPTVEQTLKNLGIQVDRDTIARYERMFAGKIKKLTSPQPSMEADVLGILIGSEYFQERITAISE